MEKQIREEGVQINLVDCAKAIMRRWYIVAIAVIAGVLISLFAFVVGHEQEYTATVKMYVNNKLDSSQGSWSQSDINASRSLVQEYLVVLKSRPTLDRTCEYVNNEYGYDLDYRDVMSMLSGGAVMETTVFQVIVTDTDKDKAVIVANAIALNFPTEVEKIFEGSSARVIEYAIDPSAVPAGHLTKLFIGAVLGFLIACAYSVIMGVFINDTIESSEWLTERFGTDIPIIGEVPDFDIQGATYGKYSSYRSRPSTSTESSGQKKPDEEKKQEVKE